MGNGIAQVAACAGYEVTMIDIEESFVERGMAAIEGSLGKLVAKERMSREDADSALARVRTSTGKGAAAECDLVVEAIPEIPELKLSTFAELDGICKPEAILASNTSSISIDEIAAATSRPDRVIGMHFMHPVPIMRLVEIINGAQTSDEVNAAVVRAAERMGKTALSCNDSPGFVSNRILCPMLNEAILTLQEGVAEPEAIDGIMKLGMNHPTGVCVVLGRRRGDREYPDLQGVLARAAPTVDVDVDSGTADTGAVGRYAIVTDRVAGVYRASIRVVQQQVEIGSGRGRQTDRYAGVGRHVDPVVVVVVTARGQVSVVGGVRSGKPDGRGNGVAGVAARTGVVG